MKTLLSLSLLLIPIMAQAKTLDVTQSVRLQPGFKEHQVVIHGPAAKEIFEALQAPDEESYIDGEEGRVFRSLDGITCGKYDRDQGQEGVCSITFDLKDGVKLTKGGGTSRDIVLQMNGNMNGAQAILFDVLPQKAGEDTRIGATIERKIGGITCVQDRAKETTKCELALDVRLGMVK